MTTTADRKFTLALWRMARAIALAPFHAGTAPPDSVEVTRPIFGMAYIMAHRGSLVRIMSVGQFEVERSPITAVEVVREFRKTLIKSKVTRILYSPSRAMEKIVADDLAMCQQRPEWNAEHAAFLEGAIPF